VLNLSGRELLSIPDPPFGRREYIRAGGALMVLKYAVDAALIYWTTGHVWTPIDYLLSLANVFNSKAAQFTFGLSLTLIIWTIPFVWVGVLLSVRRAKDAGLPPWIVVAFFIPVLNYLLMALLAAWPTTLSVSTPVPEETLTELQQRAAARKGLIVGISAGLVAGLGTVVLGTLFIQSYGGALFLLSPFVIGLVSAYASRRVNPRADLPLKVVLYTLGVIAGGCVIFALEGIGCLLMAAPLAIPLAVLGGVVGHHMAREQVRGTIAMLLVVLPTGHGIDRFIDNAPAREVHSAIEIASSRETVWRHVVSFEEIRTPPAWYFRIGLAYPLRARIDGTGVGAVRLCEFTTGAFTEPITAWDAPHRLAFDVTSQPAPLQEWSPYRKVYAPHLKGFFQTTRGEFRLATLSNGGTRLEGRTWYTLRMQPQVYWTLFADAIVHRIHQRVLEHIKLEAEADR
jgi:hypothetical protein